MLHLETIAPTTLELLVNLQRIKALNDTRLVGGTSLALQYGHRISVDLDLFTKNKITDFITIITEIKSKGYKIEIRKQTPSILISMIENVKVDIVSYPYEWLDNKKCEENIVFATDKDIAAMKLSAITNRGTKKDFIDLYYLLRNFTLEQMLSFYSEKYTDGSTFMVLKSLTWFDDADLEILPNMMDKTVKWSDIKNTIKNEVIRLV